MAAEIFDVDFLDAAAPAPEVVAVPVAEAVVDSDDDVEAVPHLSPGAPSCAEALHSWWETAPGARTHWRGLGNARRQ